MEVIEISGKVAAMLVLGFLACVFAFGKVLLVQFEKRMDERAKVQETQARDDRARLAELAQEVHDLFRMLPLEYVRREDWIRFGAGIDHKLDRLGEGMNELMRGSNRARD